MEKSGIHHLALNERVEISHDDFDNHAYFPNQILCPRKKNTDCPRKSHDAERQLPPLSPSRATMSTQSDMSVPDTIRPAFDPHLDIATVVFSHVQCVKTRVNLAVVSKLWRDASKPAAAYPRTFDFGLFPDMHSWTRLTRVIGMLDNDEALSLPYERVVGLLIEEAAKYPRLLCNYAAYRGSVRLLKWTRENNRDWGTHTCSWAVRNGHLPALQYLHENGCPWDKWTCDSAANEEHWDCLQYAVDNKCRGWEFYAKEFVEHLR